MMTQPTTALESRANWMIGQYSNVSIGGPTPSVEGQKFGWADVLARLKLNPNDRRPIQRFLDLMRASNFNVAFMPAGAAWIMCKHWNKFTAAERNNIILPRLRNRDLLSHGTENHFLVRYVGAHLFAQLWPNETSWYNVIQRRNNTSSELRAFTKSRILTTLRSLYSKGLDEHLSPNYIPVHFYPLHALFTCASDPQLKAAANAALTYHTSDMAANYFEGSTIAPYNRESPQQRSLPQSNSHLNTHIKALYWLYWAETMNVSSTPPVTFPSSGSQNSGGEAQHFAVTSALSDWRPPNLLANLAAGTNILPFSLKSANCRFGEFATGPAGYTIRSIYRSQNFAVGTGNFSHRLRGFNERAGYEIFYKSNDSQNTIVCHHPYWRTNVQHSSITSPGVFPNPAQSRWLARSSPFQQNVQHESTVISLFNIPTSDPFQGRTERRLEEYRLDTRDANGVNRPIQEAWVRYPKSADEIIEVNGWIFLREGPTYIAIRPWLSYTKVTNEFADFDVIRSSGSKNVVITELANAANFSSFDAFRSAVLAAPLTVDLNALTVSYRNTKGDTISAQYGSYDFNTEVVDSFPSFSVNGTPQVVRDPDFTGSRAVIKSAPLSVVNRVLAINLPEGRLSVDWRGTLPVFSNS